MERRVPWTESHRVRLWANDCEGFLMSGTYKAVQVVAPGRLELVEKAVPQPGPGQARIRVEACGICHTDVLTVEAQSPGLELPRVPGHEVIGKIDAIGAGVTSWKLGQRVGVGFLAGHCGVCEACRRGHFTGCAQQRYTGLHVDGGYAEFMLAQANALAAIPEALSSAEAAPLFCAGVTTFNAVRKSRARPGDLVAIQGVGGLGHLGIQFARHMGFRVAAIARGPEKEALAKELGAHHYIDSKAQDVAAELRELGGARAIVATAASPSSMGPLLGGLARRGDLIVVGAGAEPITLDPTALLFGERRVEGSITGSPIESEDTFAFSVLEGIRPMIETAPLSEAAAAYRRMTQNEARFRMVLTTGR